MADEAPYVSAQLREELLSILDEIMRIDGAASGKIRLCDPQTGALSIAVQRGFSEEFVDRFATVAVTDDYPTAVAARRAQRVIVNDLHRQDVEAKYSSAMRAERLRAMQVTPIVGSEGNVIGTLATCFRTSHYVSASGAIALDHWARRAARVIEEAARDP